MTINSYEELISHLKDSDPEKRMIGVKDIAEAVEKNKDTDERGLKELSKMQRGSVYDYFMYFILGENNSMLTQTEEMLASLLNDDCEHIRIEAAAIIAKLKSQNDHFKLEALKIRKEIQRNFLDIPFPVGGVIPQDKD